MYRGGTGCFIRNIFDSNGDYGYNEIAEVQTTVFTGNVFYNHAVAGMNFSSASIRNVYNNNTFVNNTTFGIDFNGSMPKQFSNNHAFGNGSPSDIATTDAEWLILYDGDNIVGGPLATIFTDAANGNFIPTSSSPLIDAGVGGTGDTIGALCATAGGGGGGGVKINPGTTGGIGG
jgi:hypothetical protein